MNDPNNFEQNNDLGTEEQNTPAVDETQNGYTVTAIFNKNDINTGEGDIYFNAYRIDTDGGKYVKNEQLLYALNPTMRGKFHTPNKFLWLKNYVK